MKIAQRQARGVKGIVALLVAGLCLVLGSDQLLASPSARDIMAQADKMNRAKYEVAQMQMQLLDGPGKMLERKLIWYFQNKNDDRTSMLKFTAPAEVESVGLLVKEQGGQTNAIWQYLPGVRSVRRISAEHKQNSFMGTEFVFEDFEGLKLNLYTFTMLGTQPCNDTDMCYRIDAKPSSADEQSSSGYSHKIYWIDTKQYSIVEVELYDRGGQLEKRFVSSGFHAIKGYWRPDLQEMTNIHTHRSTRLTVLHRTIDVPFQEYYLSQAYLHSEN